MLAALLLLESDGEIPASSAIGQATRMAKSQRRGIGK